MSASPQINATPSTKRPLDDESSPSGLTDQPDAKRPALDKSIKHEAEETKPIPEPVDRDVVDDETRVKAEDSKGLANGHADTKTNGTSIVLDTATAAGPSATSVLETQPIQSTANQHDRATSQGPMHHHQDETGWLHIRAVISSAEAATVIGKGGENVSQIRRLSGAKCTVSDYSRGAVERILTVSGLVDATAKVFSQFQISRKS
jgi:heterogeneous nuclear rnp K-like protein 2